MERTLNMYSMDVTLDVSRLGGWLNADAPCGVRGGIMDRNTAATLKGIAGRIWVCRFRACTERTENMPDMSVTLDVSHLEMSALKLSKL